MAIKGYFIVEGSFVLDFECFILPICYTIDKSAKLNTEFHNTGYTYHHDFIKASGSFRKDTVVPTEESRI